MPGKVFVGTSGYSYKHWSDGVFYPAGLPQKKWLEFYSSHFNTVELNVTFYRLPAYSQFERWRQATPEGFVFSVKGSRFITHARKLKECGGPLERFFSQAGGLREKFGVTLWQLPPDMPADTDRLEEFCRKLSENSQAAAIGQAFEFRHPTWFSAETYECLERHNFALCAARSPNGPVAKVSTADFAYLRFHGRKNLYASSYGDSELAEFADMAIERLKQGKDVFSYSKKAVYAYFNNDAFGYAVKNALKMRQLIAAGLEKKTA